MRSALWRALQAALNLNWGQIILWNSLPATCADALPLEQMLDSSLHTNAFQPAGAEQVAVMISLPSQTSMITLSSQSREGAGTHNATAMDRCLPEHMPSSSQFHHQWAVIRFLQAIDS